MKKVIIITCLAFMSLVSCSNQNKDVEQPIRTVSAETTTEAEIPPATEAETLGKILHEDDNCTITYNEFKSLKTVQHIGLTIDNKTDNSLSVELTEIKINSIAIDQFYMSQLKSKESASHPIVIINSKLQDENITRVNNIEFKLQITVTDKTNGDCLAYYETGVINIER